MSLEKTAIQKLTSKVYDLQVENEILLRKIEEYKSYEQFYKNQM